MESILEKRQASPTSTSALATATNSQGSADPGPTIAGSFWAFIGVIVGAAVVLLILLGIGYAILHYRRKNGLVRRAGRGNNLSTSHPAPFGSGGAAGRGGNSAWQTLHDADDDENDAFAPRSPRQSYDYGGGYGQNTPATAIAHGGYGRYAGYDDAYDAGYNAKPYGDATDQGYPPSQPSHQKTTSAASAGDMLPVMPAAQP